jgi:uncharacterized repeat protein (TIGR02543 family)
MSAPAQAVDRDVACAGGGTFKIVGTILTSATGDCSGAVVIPADVTELANSAFEFKLSITSVTFEAGSQLKKIGNSAFAYIKITSIDLPDGLETIGTGVFRDTQNLKSLTIPGTVTSIGANLSFDGSLETLVFAPRVATTLTLPSGLIFRARNFIGPITFMGTPGPTVTTPELTPFGRTGYIWGGWATSEGGPRVTFPLQMGGSDSVLYPRWIPDIVTVHNCGTSGTFEVRNGVAGGASSSCVGDVVIPAQATSVQGFSQRKITNVTFEPGSQAKELGETAFNSSTLSSIDLPDGLEIIRGLRYTQLTSLSIPGSVKSITNAGLIENTKLESLVFESRITGAGTLSIDTLEGNRKLKTLTFMGATQLSGNPGVVKAVNTWLGWSTSEGGPIVAYPSSVVAGTTLFTNHSPKTYAVTFDSQGGTPVASGAIVGGEFQMPTPPTKVGHTFWKWVGNANDPGDGDIGVTDHYSDSNLNLQATWKPIRYAVNYVPNGGPAIAPGSFLSGSYVTVPDLGRPGYRWDGWSLIDGGPMVTNYMYFPGVNQDITLYGRWIPNSWNVYWEDAGSATIPQRTFLSGGTIDAAPVPTRVGHRFDGWRVTYNGAPPNASDPVLSFPYTPDVVREIWMYAKWTRLFVVTYNSRGTDVSNSFFGEGESINAAAAVPMRAGYTLSWSKTEDGGEVVSFPYTPGVSRNITLYAKWTPNLNSVFFNSNRGTSVANGSFFTDSSVFQAPDEPTRRGYTFNHWSETEGGDAILFPYFSGATSDITLFAKWTANTYVVKHDSKNGTPVVVAGSYQTDSQANFTAPETPAVRAGYTFLGWSATEGGSMLSFPLTPDDIGDITISAVWDAHTHTVNLNTKSGSSVPAVSFKTDAAITTAPQTPVRAGYTFLGWSATDGGTVVSFPYAPGVIGDITLYALWEANTHSVNLILNGGSSVPAVSFRTDAAINSAPATPIRVGYTFDGWSATEGGTLITFPYTPGVIEAITLYSKWTRNPYKPELLANSTVAGTGYQSTNMVAKFGSWSAYPDAAMSMQWYRCDKSVSAGLSSIPASKKCEKIARATRAKYKLVEADELKYLTVLVQAKNTIGTTFTTSKSFRALALKAPTKVKLPVIKGAAVARKLLTADIGTWKSNPIAKTSVQWFRCEGSTKVSAAPVPTSATCVAIKGATKSRYLLSKADEGMYVTSQIEAVNTEGTAFTTAKSTRVALTPSIASNPGISGSSQIGKVLTANSGSWLAFPAAKTSVKWFRCNKETAPGAKMFGGSARCVAIKGATKARYTVSAADKGKHISALITAENVAGKTTATAESEQVAFEPSKTGNPSISGSAVVGRTLNASPGRWSAFPEAQTSFKWFRCASPTQAGSEAFARASGCVAIGGANNSSYTVKEADKDKYLSVLVKAANSAGSSTATARSTGKVG